MAPPKWAPHKWEHLKLALPKGEPHKSLVNPKLTLRLASNMEFPNKIMAVNMQGSHRWEGRNTPILYMASQSMKNNNNKHIIMPRQR